MLNVDIAALFLHLGLASSSGGLLGGTLPGLAFQVHEDVVELRDLCGLLIDLLLTVLLVGVAWLAQRAGYP